MVVEERTGFGHVKEMFVTVGHLRDRYRLRHCIDGRIVGAD